jgi:hypothetical protein
MDDDLIQDAAKLKAELAARGHKWDVAIDVILSNAGDWFSSLNEKDKAQIILTMRIQALSA